MGESLWTELWRAQLRELSLEKIVDFSMLPICDLGFCERNLRAVVRVPILPNVPFVTIGPCFFVAVLFWFLVLVR